MAQKYVIALYDHKNDMFIHPVFNAEWHAKFGLPLF
jgi:hypothetical protein